MSPEETIVQLASKGCTDKQIAQELGIRQEQVAALWKRVLSRAKVRSRTELIAKILSEEMSHRIESLSDELMAMRTEVAEMRTRDLQHTAVAQRFAAVLESLDSGVLFESSDRRILRINRRFCELFELPDGPEAYVDQPSSMALTSVHRELIKQGRVDEYVNGTDWIELTNGRFIERNHLTVEQGGQLHGHFWTFRDATRTRLMEEQLRFRGDLASLVLDLAVNIMEGNSSTESSIRKMLQAVGNEVSADRAYVVKLLDGELRVTIEWCSPGVRGRIDSVPSSLKSWWIKQMKSEDSIALQSLDELPPHESLLRSHFESQGVVSVVAVPIKIGRDFHGYIGFDSVHVQRNWTPEVVSVLQSMANVVSSSYCKTLAKN